MSLKKNLNASKPPSVNINILNNQYNNQYNKEHLPSQVVGGGRVVKKCTRYGI